MSNNAEIAPDHAAFVTLLYTDDYLPGVLALVESIKEVKSKHGLLVVAPLDALKAESMSMIRSAGAKLSLVNMTHEHYSGLDAGSAFPQLGQGIWLRLHLWTLTEYTALLSLDAESLLLQNVDELFYVEHFTSGPAYFPGGLLVVKPSMTVHQEMLQIHCFE